MGKIILKTDAEKNISVDVRRLTPKEVMDVMTISLTRIAIELGISKKEVLDGTKFYYEEIMKNEANK